MQATYRRDGAATLRVRLGTALLFAAVLAGCASGPQRAGAPPTSPDRDGPEANPPADLARVPDAEPKLEPIRSGGRNKPYEVLGKSYVPITQDAPFTERGLASWYGRKFHGRRTASGEVYNMYAMTAAHPTLRSRAMPASATRPTARRWSCASTTAGRSIRPASST